MTRRFLSRFYEFLFESRNKKKGENKKRLGNQIISSEQARKSTGHKDTVISDSFSEDVDIM